MSREARKPGKGSGQVRQTGLYNHRFRKLRKQRYLSYGKPMLLKLVQQHGGLEVKICMNDGPELTFYAKVKFGRGCTDSSIGRVSDSLIAWLWV